MTVFVIPIGLLMAWRVAAWMRQRHHPSWETLVAGPRLRRRPRRSRRFDDRRRRRQAAEAARALAAMLAAGYHDPVAHLASGVVLQPGEVPWARARARLATWDTRAAQVVRSRVRWSGRRAQSAAREVTVGGWRDHGEIDWLITSRRLVGRTRSDGELLSIWWGGLAGVGVDLDVDTVHLDGDNGWRGHLSGPGVAPIGVAAVAACHGPEALAVHPGLARLRRPSTPQADRPPVPEPLALGPGDPPANLWSRERLP